ncbi:MAG: response regulator transcription factor [Bacteroidota bacterium]|nr:response regulator transcription factor [Bacteroidota bacterium]
MEKIDILVVDDSENFRELIKDFLEQQQEVQKVTTAVSGKEAIESLEKFIPKVILMDIVMPGLNGFETSEIIRSKFPDMPIIILSGNEVTDAREMIEKLKLNGFVNKVNLVSELIPAIFKSLRKRNQ